MTRRSHSHALAGWGALLLGIAIPMWIIGSIHWNDPAPQSAWQKIVLVSAYVAASLATLLGVAPIASRRNSSC